MSLTVYLYIILRSCDHGVSSTRWCCYPNIYIVTYNDGLLVTSECRKEESIKLSGRVSCAILKSVETVLFHLVDRADMLRLMPLLSQYILKAV